VLKVNATPTAFVNGEMLKSSMSFDELGRKIKLFLKK
jgi:protein-disulfide isomerase